MTQSKTQPETFALRQKSAHLHAALSALDGLLVAYSGGTDSAFLAHAAHFALGDRMLAVIADSPSLPRAELAAALAFTAAHSIPTQILHTAELANPAYAVNDRNRCFHCKDELFNQMESARLALSFSHIAYGMNSDDNAPGQSEFRPGQRAAALHNALTPLLDAQLSKSEIRTLARAAGLSVADKPASACLSSRIAYGLPVSAENLSQIERAEEALHTLGFPAVRIRHHGDLARIEIARTDLPRALHLPTLDAITAALHPLGFHYVTLDTQGYRTGSMNEVLPITAITTAK